MPNPFNYIQNLGKSVVYSSVDRIKEMNPSLEAFAEENAELGKVLYESVKDFKGTTKRAKDYVIKSKVGEFAVEYKKSLFESIKTGKLYSKEQEDRYSSMGAGALLDDSLDMDDFFEIDHMDDEPPKKSKSDFDTVSDMEIVDNIGGKITNGVAMATAKSAEYQVEAYKDGLNRNMRFTSALHDRLNANLGAVNSTIANLNKFNVEVSQNFYKSSETFYTNMHQLTKSNNDYLKQIVDMMGKQYKTQEEERKSSNRGRSFSDITNDGMLNIKDYANVIKENINAATNNSLGMLNSIGGEGSNGLLAFAANPLKFIPDLIAKKILPDAIGKATKDLNKSLTGLFSGLLLKAYAGSNDFDANFITQNLWRLIGIDINRKTKIDVDKYNRGAIPWDGESKMALTRVIPDYLSKILAAQTGMSEMLFDYKSGRYINASDLQESHKASINSAADSAASEIKKYIKDMYDNTIDWTDNRGMKENFEKSLDNLFRDVVANPRLLEIRKRKKGESWDTVFDRLFGSVDADEYSKALIMSALQNIGKTNPHIIQEFSKNLFSARDATTRMMKEKEKNASSVDRILFNGFGVDEFALLGKNKDKNGRYENVFDVRDVNLKKTKNPNLINNIYLVKDDKNHNIFWYLQRYTAEFEKMRMEGVKVRGDSRIEAESTYTPSDSLPGENSEKKRRRKKGKRYDTTLNGYGVSSHEDYKTRNTIHSENSIKLDERFNADQKRRAEKRQKNDKYGSYYFTAEDLRNKDDIEKTMKYISGVFDANSEAQTRHANERDRLEREKKNEDKVVAGIRDAEGKKNIFDAIINGANDLAHSPAKFLAGVIEKVDKRLFEVIYGHEDEDKLSTKSFIGNLMAKLTGVFSDFKNYLKDEIYEPLKETLFGEDGFDLKNKAIQKLKDGFGQDTLKKMFGDKIEYVKGAFKDTYGKLYSGHLNNYQELSNLSPEMQKKVQEAVMKSSDILGPYAFGRQIETIDDKGNVVYTDKSDNRLIHERNKILNDVDAIIDPLNSKHSAQKAFIKQLKDREAYEASLKANKSISSKKRKNAMNKYDIDLFYKLSKNNNLNDLLSSYESDYVLDLQKRYNESNSKEEQKAIYNEMKEFIRKRSSNEYSKLYRSEYGKDMKIINQTKENAFLNLISKGHTIPELLESGYNKAIPRLKSSFSKMIKYGDYGDNDPQVVKKTLEALSYYEDGVGETFSSKRMNKITNKIRQYARGGEVEKTGIAAVSEGEIIIPSEYNPFYKGSNNKALQRSKEYSAKKNFTEFLMSLKNNEIDPRSISGYADGKDADEVPNEPKEKKKKKKKNKEKKSKSENEGEPPNKFSQWLENGKAKRAREKEIDKKFSDEDIVKIGIEIESGSITEDNIEYNYGITMKEFDAAVMRRKLGGQIAQGAKSFINGAKTVINELGLVEGGKQLITAMTGKDWDVDTNDEEKEKLFNEMKKDLSDKLGDYAPSAAGAAILGMGASLFTGGLVGPIMGAALGAGVDVAVKSGKVQDWLFGEAILDKDGKKIGRKGNILSKHLSENVEKYFPDMAKGAVVGGITSILPFVPGGPVSGIILGSSIGFAKNNEKMNKFLFGEEGDDESGLLSKKRRDFLKQHVPEAVLGGAIGMFTGPFGLVGNTVLGSALGFAACTDKFQDALFGKWNEATKQREGGLIGIIREGFVKPLINFGEEFIKTAKDKIKENIFDPLQKAFMPILTQLGVMGRSIGTAILGFTGRFGKRLGGSSAKTLGEKIGRFTSGVIKTGVKAGGSFLSPAFGIATAPIRGLGAIGDALKGRQIRKGNATYMTSTQRNIERLERENNVVYDKYTSDEYGKNEEGQEVLLHRKGEIKLDEFGDPIIKKKMKHKYFANTFGRRSLNRHHGLGFIRHPLDNPDKFEEFDRIIEEMSKEDLKRLSDNLGMVNDKNKIIKTKNNSIDNVNATLSAYRSKMGEHNYAHAAKILRDKKLSSDEKVNKINKLIRSNKNLSDEDKVGFLSGFSTNMADYQSADSLLDATGRVKDHFFKQLSDMGMTGINEKNVYKFKRYVDQELNIKKEMSPIDKLNEDQKDRHQDILNKFDELIDVTKALNNEEELKKVKEHYLNKNIEMANKKSGFSGFRMFGKYSKTGSFYNGNYTIGADGKYYLDGYPLKDDLTFESEEDELKWKKEHGNDIRTNNEDKYGETHLNRNAMSYVRSGIRSTAGFVFGNAWSKKNPTLYDNVNGLRKGLVNRIRSNKEFKNIKNLTDDQLKDRLAEMGVTDDDLVDSDGNPITDEDGKVGARRSIMHRMIKDGTVSSYNRYKNMGDRQVKSRFYDDSELANSTDFGNMSEKEKIEEMKKKLFFKKANEGEEKTVSDFLGNPIQWIKDSKNRWVRKTVSKNKDNAFGKSLGWIDNKFKALGTDIKDGFMNFFKISEEDGWMKKMLKIGTRIVGVLTLAGLAPIAETIFNEKISPKVKNWWENSVYPKIEGLISPIKPTIAKMAIGLDGAIRAIPNAIYSLGDRIKGFINNDLPGVWSNKILPFYSNGIDWVGRKIEWLLGGAGNLIGELLPHVIKGIAAGIKNIFTGDWFYNLTHPDRIDPTKMIDKNEDQSIGVIEKISKQYSDNTEDVGTFASFYSKVFGSSAAKDAAKTKSKNKGKSTNKDKYSSTTNVMEDFYMSSDENEEYPDEVVYDSYSDGESYDDYTNDSTNMTMDMTTSGKNVNKAVKSSTKTSGSNSNKSKSSNKNNKTNTKEESSNSNNTTGNKRTANGGLLDSFFNAANNVVNTGNYEDSGEEKDFFRSASKEYNSRKRNDRRGNTDVEKGTIGLVKKSAGINYFDKNYITDSGDSLSNVRIDSVGLVHASDGSIIPNIFFDPSTGNFTNKPTKALKDHFETVNNGEYSSIEEYHDKAVYLAKQNDPSFDSKYNESYMLSQRGSDMKPIKFEDGDTSELDSHSNGLFDGFGFNKNTFGGRLLKGWTRNVLKGGTDHLLSNLATSKKGIKTLLHPTALAAKIGNGGSRLSNWAGQKLYSSKAVTKLNEKILDKANAYRSAKGKAGRFINGEFFEGADDATVRNAKEKASREAAESAVERGVRSATREQSESLSKSYIKKLTEGAIGESVNVGSKEFKKVTGNLVQITDQYGSRVISMSSLDRTINREAQLAIDRIAREGVEEAASNKGIVKNIIEQIHKFTKSAKNSKFVSKIANSLSNDKKKLVGTMIDKLDSFLVKHITKLGSKLGGRLANMAARLAGGAATGGLVTMAFLVWDFGSGFRSENVASAYGISVDYFKSLPIYVKALLKILNGIIEAAKGTSILFTLIPTSFIYNFIGGWIFDHAGSSAEELKKGQKEVVNFLSQYNSEHGTLYESIEEYNNAQKWERKTWRDVTNFLGFGGKKATQEEIEKANAKLKSSVQDSGFEFGTEDDYTSDIASEMEAEESGEDTSTTKVEDGVSSATNTEEGWTEEIDPMATSFFEEGYNPFNEKLGISGGKSGISSNNRFRKKLSKKRRKKSNKSYNKRKSLYNKLSITKSKSAKGSGSLSAGDSILNPKNKKGTINTPSLYKDFTNYQMLNINNSLGLNIEEFTELTNKSEDKLYEERKKVNYKNLPLSNEEYNKRVKEYDKYNTAINYKKDPFYFTGDPIYGHDNHFAVAQETNYGDVRNYTNDMARKGGPTHIINDILVGMMLMNGSNNYGAVAWNNGATGNIGIGLLLWTGKPQANLLHNIYNKDKSYAKSEMPVTSKFISKKKILRQSLIPENERNGLINILASRNGKECQIKKAFRDTKKIYNKVKAAGFTDTKVIIFISIISAYSKTIFEDILSDKTNFASDMFLNKIFENVITKYQDTYETDMNKFYYAYNFASTTNVSTDTGLLINKQDIEKYIDDPFEGADGSGENWLEGIFTAIGKMGKAWLGLTDSSSDVKTYSNRDMEIYNEFSANMLDYNEYKSNTSRFALKISLINSSYTDLKQKLNALVDCFNIDNRSGITILDTECSEFRDELAEKSKTFKEKYVNAKSENAKIEFVLSSDFKKTILSEAGDYDKINNPDKKTSEFLNKAKEADTKNRSTPLNIPGYDKPIIPPSPHMTSQTSNKDTNNSTSTTTVPTQKLIDRYTNNSNTTLGGLGSGLSAGASGFVSQFDYGSARFADGDSLAESGCGPAVAAMAINNLKSGKGSNAELMSATAAYANKYKDEGGTNINYFSDIMGKAGANTSYVNNSSSIKSSLRKGEQVVLMGRDASNTSKDNSPFGPNNHYVLATGEGNGKITVNDPEQQGPRTYDEKILNKTQMGVSISGKGSGFRNKMSGKASRIKNRNSKISAGATTGNGIQGVTFNIPDGCGTIMHYQSSDGMGYNAGKIIAASKVDAVGCRTVNGRFCVSITPYLATRGEVTYTGVNGSKTFDGTEMGYHMNGTYFDAYLADGTRIPCIVCDIKGRDNKGEGADWGHDNGRNVLEFVKTKKVDWKDNPGSKIWINQWKSAGEPYTSWGPFENNPSKRVVKVVVANVSWFEDKNVSADTSIIGDGAPNTTVGGASVTGTTVGNSSNSKYAYDESKGIFANIINGLTQMTNGMLGIKEDQGTNTSTDSTTFGDGVSLPSNAEWVETVKAVKQAFINAGFGYTLGGSGTININGESKSVRTDCSGFVSECVSQFIGKHILLSSRDYIQSTNKVLTEAGFKSRSWNGWDTLSEGDIIAKDGHVEIFCGNEGAKHNVYNFGGTTSANTLITPSAKTEYTTVWSAPESKGTVSEKTVSKAKENTTVEGYDSNGVKTNITETTTKGGKGKKGGRGKKKDNAKGSMLPNHLNQYFRGNNINKISAKGSNLAYDVLTGTSMSGGRSKAYAYVESVIKQMQEYKKQKEAEYNSDINLADSLGTTSNTESISTSELNGGKSGIIKKLKNSGNTANIDDVVRMAYNRTKGGTLSIGRGGSSENDIKVLLYSIASLMAENVNNTADIGLILKVIEKMSKNGGTSKTSTKTSNKKTQVKTKSKRSGRGSGLDDDEEDGSSSPTIIMNNTTSGGSSDLDPNVQKLVSMMESLCKS